MQAVLLARKNSKQMASNGSAEFSSSASPDIIIHCLLLAVILSFK
jgi:hypothetical protein